MKAHDSTAAVRSHALFGGVVCIISMLRRINRPVTEYFYIGHSGKKIAMHRTDGAASRHKWDAILNSRRALGECFVLEKKQQVGSPNLCARLETLFHRDATIQRLVNLSQVVEASLSASRFNVSATCKCECAHQQSNDA